MPEIDSGSLENDKLPFLSMRGGGEGRPAALIDGFELRGDGRPAERRKDGPFVLAANHPDQLPTVDELASILYHENGPLRGTHVRDAALQMGYVVLNRARKGVGWGQGRGTASQVLTPEEARRVKVKGSPDSEAYAIAKQAASDVLSGQVPDITEGAINYNHRVDDAVGATKYSGAPSLLQYGPFGNAATPYRYVDIYGADDRSNRIYLTPPYDSLDGPHVWTPRTPQSEEP